MKLAWSKRAFRRLASIQDWIAKDSPEAAIRVAEILIQSASRLERFPLIGRTGRISGTREPVISGLPYVNPYRVVDKTVQILSVIHTSRRWPEQL